MITFPLSFIITRKRVTTVPLPLLPDAIVITLKKSLFYKDVVYDIENDTSDKNVYISLDRVFSPFSRNSNGIEKDPALFNDLKDKTIKIVNNKFDAIYEIKSKYA